jgi:Zn-dependent protease
VAVAAGPFSNLILAILCVIPFWFGMQFDAAVGARDFVPTVSNVFSRLVLVNLILFLFNLIPLFPLDGWTIMLKLLPTDLSYRIGRYQREAMFLFFALIFLSFVGINVFSQIINPPLVALLDLLYSPRQLFLLGGRFANIGAVIGLVVCAGLVIATAVIVLWPQLRGSRPPTRR